MPNYSFSRNILQQRQQLKRLYDASRHNVVRNVTVAAGEKYEDPALASAKPFEEIPKIPMLPFVGSSWIYFPIIGRHKLDRAHQADIEKHLKYGDIVRERAGHLNIVNSYKPEAMEMFFKQEGKYPFRGEFSSLKAYRQKRKDWYTTTGVMVLNGKEWYDLRSKVQKHLMKPKAVVSYLEPMQDVARDLVSLLRLTRQENKEVPELLEKLYKWALESVAYVGLDTRLDSLNPKLSAESDGMKMIEAVQTTFICMNKLEAFTGNVQYWKYFPSPTWNKFEKASDVFTQIAFKYINLSLANLKKRKDEDADLTLLQSMLMTKDLDVSGAMVTVADMLMAGIDTTSHTVGFLLYTLAQNPEKQEKVLKEIEELLPNKEDRVTPAIFNKLHYLKACIKESIRLYPIVRGNARTFDHDVVLDGYRIPAGTAVFCVLQVIYRKEKYFKDADKFFPERWLDKEEKPLNPFAYLPFGFGSRACVGRRLAELEIICLAVEIIRNFKVEYHHEPLDMLTRLVNIPDRPLKFSFLDR